MTHSCLEEAEGACCSQEFSGEEASELLCQLVFSTVSDQLKQSEDV